MDRQNLRIPEEMRQLPTFYWLPKMHKNPTGSRFIAASSGCTTKPLSQLLTSCLKLVTQHFKEYCEGIARNTGVNCLWITDNSFKVLRKLSKLNRTRRAEHFDTFDFSPSILIYPMIYFCRAQNNLLARHIMGLEGPHT